MIVNKPIGAVRIGNTISRLTVGKPVPKNIIEFWKSNGTYQKMIDNGSISDSGKTEKFEKKPEVKPEKKSESKVEENMFKDKE